MPVRESAATQSRDRDGAVGRTPLPYGRASAVTATSSAAGVRLSLLTDTADLENLRPEWERLLSASTGEEPMLSPDWLLTWWRVYATGRTLSVGVFRDGDALVGIAPLMRRRFWYRPGIPFRRLEFLGADVDEQDGVCSEYLNVIAARGAEQTVAAALIDELSSGGFGAWDEVVLSAMDGLSPMPELLAEAGRRAGLLVDSRTTTEAPYIALPTTWEEYLAALPKKKRYGIVRALRDFESWNGGPLRLEKAVTAEDLRRGKEILARLHNERWQAAGHAGAFGTPRFVAFHDALMPRLLAAGKLELMWLCVKGEPVAATYNIVANGKTEFYQCGRKLDVPQGQRPGIVLIALAIQEAIRAGRREFDFLGGVSLYKTQLALTKRPLVQFRLARPTLRETLRRGADRAIQGLRYVRNKSRGVASWLKDVCCKRLCSPLAPREESKEPRDAILSRSERATNPVNGD